MALVYAMVVLLRSFEGIVPSEAEGFRGASAGPPLRQSSRGPGPSLSPSCRKHEDSSGLRLSGQRIALLGLHVVVNGILDTIP